MPVNQYMAEQINAPTTLQKFRSQGHEMILMDKAHGMMLVKQGLLSAEDYKTCAEGLDWIDANMTEADVKGELGDLYYNITDQLYKRVGQKTADLLHVGRSRNDMGRTVNRMHIRRELLWLMEEVNGLMTTIADLAGKNLDTVITYYTYGQPSQPGTLAHYLMLCFDLLARDYKRLQAAYANTNYSAMGTAAGIGTGFPLDPQYVAELLGFDGVIENTTDATASQDFLLEVEADVSIMMTSLSKMAQDLFFWASYEYGILDCDDSVAGGSSIMPQKKNPVVFEQARASSAHASGLLNDALALNRNTTLFPHIDGTVEMYYVFDRCMHEAAKAIGLLKVGLENSHIRKKKSYEYTRDNFTAATTVAEVLSRRYGVPFTETHHILHGMIHALMEKDAMSAKYLTGKLMEEVSGKVLEKPLIMTDEEVQQLMDPMFCLEDKVTGGTPKPADTEKMLQQNILILDEQKKWLEGKRIQIERAYARIAAGQIE